MAVHGIVVSVILGKTENDVSTLQVSGYLDITTAAELENALAGLLQDDHCKVVVDLSRVTYISSAGWGIFIGEIKGIRNQGGDLKLAGMTSEVYEVFQLLEFQSILESYASAEEAVTAFEKSGAKQT